MNKPIPQPKTTTDSSHRAYVTCPHCKRHNKPGEFEFVNIEEDVCNRDVMTFKCVQCRKEGSSLIFIGSVPS